MDRLRLIFEKHSRWQPYSLYLERIEGYRDSDFSICVENSKSLLEGIAKEICAQKRQTLEGSESVSKVLSLSFGCLGYPPTDTVRQIGTAIANVGQQMGNFRNEIGTTSHGKTLEELRSREEIVSSLTGDFLLISIELVCCFLIETFEADNPLAPVEPEIQLSENPEFNEAWDEHYGEFRMGDYSFSASTVLFNIDPLAYKTEADEFNSAARDFAESLADDDVQSIDETDNGK